MPRLPSAGSLLLVLCVFTAEPAAAQTSNDGLRLEAEAASAAGNVLLGGLAGGLHRMVRGGSFAEGFEAGAAGGLATYAGKRVAAARFTGAGLLGRQLAAVGSSMTRNGGEGRPMLESVMLPLGPVRLYANVPGGAPVRARVDAANLVATVATAFKDDVRFDWETSLSSGAPVFRRAGPGREVGWDGTHIAGVVTIRDLEPMELENEHVARGAVLAHEQIHVIHYDQTFLLVAEPLERWALSRSAWGRALHEHVDLGSNMLLWAGLNGTIPYRARPWELEADALSGSDRPAEGRSVTP